MLNLQADQAFDKRIAKLPFGKHPGLLIDPLLEGYRDYTFGGRAGPVVSIFNLFHEMAHATQFGAENFLTRASSDGFVFETPGIFVYDRICVEPQTSQATERELETFAYQLHLMRSAGCRVNEKTFFTRCANLMIYMPDWLNVPGASDEKRIAWCINKIEDTFQRITKAETLDRLESWLDATAAHLVLEKA